MRRLPVARNSLTKFLRELPEPSPGEQPSISLMAVASAGSAVEQPTITGRTRRRYNPSSVCNDCTFSRSTHRRRRLKILLRIQLEPTDMPWSRRISDQNCASPIGEVGPYFQGASGPYKRTPRLRRWSLPLSNSCLTNTRISASARATSAVSNVTRVDRPARISRFARGEIDKAEFEEKRRIITERKFGRDLKFAGGFLHSEQECGRLLMLHRDLNVTSFRAQLCYRPL